MLAEQVSLEEVQLDMQLQVGGHEADNPFYGLVGVVVFKGIVKVDGVKDNYVGLLLYAPLGDTDGKLGDHRYRKVCVRPLLIQCRYFTCAHDYGVIVPANILHRPPSLQELDAFWTVQEQQQQGEHDLQAVAEEDEEKQPENTTNPAETATDAPDGENSSSDEEDFQSVLDTDQETQHAQQAKQHGVQTTRPSFWSAVYNSTAVDATPEDEEKQQEPEVDEQEGPGAVAVAAVADDRSEGEPGSSVDDHRKKAQNIVPTSPAVDGAGSDISDSSSDDDDVCVASVCLLP